MVGGVSTSHLVILRDVNTPLAVLLVIKIILKVCLDNVSTFSVFHEMEKKVGNHCSRGLETIELQKLYQRLSDLKQLNYLGTLSRYCCGKSQIIN